ncbi:dihydropteroate synthase [Pantoea sp. Mhis]|uniref:dihydropteroate synthase n=1 Tax=Pantoea sp. Mhis TaxID=2576759 RepID=UPI00135A5A72|nr:dihydropteroate synthase [Pantoea sp. Mhis]MXP56443.1 dihydropteroate synthase [Pantoea sp. Mhis]
MKLCVRNTYLDLSFTRVMGILNVTPDSFYDGGRHNTSSDILGYVSKMIKEGASIIDIGGESTRPGAEEISLQEELERVIPVVEDIAKRFSVWISVNTSKSTVIHEAARAGAHMINDIRSLTKPDALDAAVQTGLVICLVHMQGEPCNMQHAPYYNNIVSEVDEYFTIQISRCKEAGIKENNLLLDPGFGFGKDLHHNYELLANLKYFHRFKIPILIGISRKSMVSRLLEIKTSQSLTGSLSCAVIAAMQKVHIIRVHDVKETIEALCIVKATQIAKG